MTLEPLLWIRCSMSCRCLLDYIGGRLFIRAEFDGIEDSSAFLDDPVGRDRFLEQLFRRLVHG